MFVSDGQLCVASASLGVCRAFFVEQVHCKTKEVLFQRKSKSCGVHSVQKNHAACGPCPVQLRCQNLPHVVGNVHRFPRMRASCIVENVWVLAFGDGTVEALCHAMHPRAHAAQLPVESRVKTASGVRTPRYVRSQASGAICCPHVCFHPVVLVRIDHQHVVRVKSSMTCQKWPDVVGLVAVAHVAVVHRRSTPRFVKHVLCDAMQRQN